eukprot:7947673-Alexandrium_andersonii.AAC.1
MALLLGAADTTCSTSQIPGPPSRSNNRLSSRRPVCSQAQGTHAARWKGRTRPTILGPTRWWL